MKIGPVMKGVGRKIFYINCLYGVKMRGEKDTEGVMARELRDAWDGYRIREGEKVCVRECVCAAACTGSCSSGCALIIHDGTLEAIL